MSRFKELDLLREQEQTLIQLHMNFSDQLNRLKVEELALTSKLRLQKEREMQAQTGTTDNSIEAEDAIEQETMNVLNLVVDNPAKRGGEEVEEEEEEEEDNAEEREADKCNEQLSMYIENLLQQQQAERQEDLELSTVRVKKEEDDDDDDI